ncbi:MAG: adenylate/guanylate cyclase domain-containing protein [Thiohalomonadaceae bacterium]
MQRLKSIHIMNYPSRLWHRLQPSYFPIAYKLALLITIAITLGMSLLGVAIVDNQTRLLRQQMINFGQAIISQAAETVKEPLLTGDAITLNLISGSLMRHGDVLGVVIYNDELEPLSHVGVAPSSSQLPTIIGNAKVDGSTTFEWQATTSGQSANATVFVASVVTRDLIVGYVLLTFSHLQLNEAKHATLQAVITATVLMILLGTVISILLGQHLSKPINKLMEASLQIFRGRYTSRIEERRNDELGTLMHAFNTMSEGLQRKEQIEQLFSRYIPSKVAREMLDNIGQAQLGGQSVEASVLFADITGFTALAEQLTPAEISVLLNEYFSVIALAAQAYSGHIDKYMGDCAMLVFGVPHADEQHALNAICCAVLIQQLITELNNQRQRRNQTPVSFHISGNSGTMLAGNMGSKDRMEYTVIGDAVNLASRLSTVTKAGQILINKSMGKPYVQTGQIIVQENNTILLRGKQQPVTTLEVQGLDKSLRKQMERHYHHILRQQTLLANS